MSESFEQDVDSRSIDQQFEKERSYNGNDQFVDRDVPLEQNKDFFQVYGMFFCGVCKNMLDPLTTKGELLEFKCKRCGNVLINFRNRLDKKCMLYSKSLAAGSRKVEADPKMIFDMSMPRMEIECPDCSYHEAVYLVAPEDGERRIVVKLICARGAQQNIVKCGNRWDLDQNLEVYDNVVKGIRTQKSIEEF